jgi:hypothetical protein
MTAKTAALVFGVIFILVGVLGYLDVAGTFKNPVVGAAGGGAIFEVNDIHSYVHLGAGAVLVVLALINMASLGLIVVGAVYGVVAALGLLNVTAMTDMVHMNQNDHYLHIALAVVLLAAGFLLKGKATAGAPGT